MVGAPTLRDFRKWQNDYRYFLVDYGGLKPEDKILDVGCGIGLAAIPLTKYLCEKGKYEGFDIVDALISWCTKNLTPRFPHFRFQVADVRNDFYNREGRYKASEYRFPFEDETFDFVYLASVFTHMLPDDVEHYISEIVRVLKPGRRCVITYFLLNAESRRLMSQGRATLNFRYDLGRCRSIDEVQKEAAVAYDEDDIRTLYRKYGLEMTKPIWYGPWCGRKPLSRRFSYQDVILAEKGASA